VLLARLAIFDVECDRVGGFVSSKSVGGYRFSAVLANCLVSLAPCGRCQISGRARRGQLDVRRVPLGGKLWKRE
jgi:hypothetical protein